MFRACFTDIQPPTAVNSHLLFPSVINTHSLFELSIMFIVLPFTDQHKGSAFPCNKRMRYSRHPPFAIIAALLLALFISVYAFKNAQRYSPPRFVRYQHRPYTPSFTLHSSAVSKARQISPTELMARPLSSASHMPKLLHQSWSSTALPAKFEQWSLSCREMNSDFEWVLWTDDDNRLLVEKFAPQFLAKYDGLKSEIYRADAVRNLYMFVFGG